MTAPRPRWLTLVRGTAPLVVSLPHTGTTIPADIARRLGSRRLALKDTDWYVERLYTAAVLLGATVLRTGISRTAIDANRDPSGTSLYPGRATTELCPTTTFDGEPLYKPGREPAAADIAARRGRYFDPYHAALAAEIARLRAEHERVVVYDCHSIRSVIPRLFDGELPHFNIGTDGGRSCDPRLTAAVEDVVAAPGLTRVTNGRFRGGYITRHHGRPADGVHAVQMELAMRGYLREPVGPVDKTNWPPAYHDVFAAPMRETLRRVLEACLAFAHSPRTVR
ncbi:MAG: N-formylglutamate deformylase [Gemmataceae bacterium]|nr:N-formylglutamate deformylase [Gemmataceae bacterium]